MKRKIIISIAFSLSTIVLLFLGLSILGGGIISGAFCNPRIDKRQMERIFAADYDLLKIVTSYLVASEYPSISLFPEIDNGLMSVFSDELGAQRISINDEAVVRAIEALRERGYGLIIKRNNTVQFSRWTMRDRGRGIVHSIDEAIPDYSAFSFLTNLEPLSVNGWYYYEEDFREWRVRYRN